MKTALVLLVSISACGVAGHAGAGEPSSGPILDYAKSVYPGDYCQWDRADNNPDEIFTYELSYRYEYEEESEPAHSATLYEVPCTMGAYNFGSVFFLETEYEGLQPLHFAEPTLDISYVDETQEQVEDVAIAGFSSKSTLINPSFDEATSTLTEFSKWRGLADASSTGNWVFRQGRFVLTLYEVDASYDGEINPLTVYEAAAR